MLCDIITNRPKRVVEPEIYKNLMRSFTINKKRNDRDNPRAHSSPCRLFLSLRILIAKLISFVEKTNFFYLKSPFQVKIQSITLVILALFCYFCNRLLKGVSYALYTLFHNCKNLLRTNGSLRGHARSRGVLHHYQKT